MMDPENEALKERAEAQSLRAGRSMWGGRDIKGKKVYIESEVYHWFGTVDSIQCGVVWIKDARKVFDNTESEISDSTPAGKISIVIDKIMALGIEGECNWCSIREE